MKTAALAFCPAAAEDNDFLVTLYGSTRQAELELTQWDDEQRHAFIRSQFAAQQNHYRTQRPAAREELILVDGDAVGRLYRDLSGDSDHLLDLCLLPSFRNNGIGSRVLKGILANAAAKGRRVTIYVETFNRSLTFFARHGFGKAAENGMHFLLEWRPETK